MELLHEYNVNSQKALCTLQSHDASLVRFQITGAYICVGHREQVHMDIYNTFTQQSLHTILLKDAFFYSALFTAFVVNKAYKMLLIQSCCIVLIHIKVSYKTIVQKLGIDMIFKNIFERYFLSSPRLHLFD